MNGGMVYTLNNLKTMSKQTAVEWLIDQLEKYELYSKVSFQCLKEIDQAKAMEKEQIETAYQAGDGDAYNLEETKTWAEQYYNETYGVKGRENKTVVEKDKVIKVPPKQGEWGDYI